MSFRAIYPFESNYLETPSGKIHYLDEGPRGAPVLLMLHGNPTWSFYFRNLVTAFRDRFRVVVPDHLGCGLSDKPQDFEYTLGNHIANVERLVEHLALEKITLVVHDWGGAIGMGFAVAHPDKISRFVVFNTAAFPSDRMPAALVIARIPGFGAFAIRGFNAFVRGALASCVVHGDRLTSDVRDGYRAPYDSWKNRIATLRFVQDIPMSPEDRAYPVLQNMAEKLSGFADHPMMIAWGAQDFVFNEYFLDEWKKRFPRAKVHYFEDAGHYVLEDAHERIIPLMNDFLGMGAS